MKYRRGAFQDMKSVLPVTIKYKHSMIHPAIESLEEPFVLFLICCTMTPIVVEVKQMPVFKPNNYLLQKHSDKGQEPWEIFAWACRDLMKKVGGFGLSEIAWREKIKVYEYYNARIDSLTLGDGTFVQYRADGKYNDTDKKN